MSQTKNLQSEPLPSEPVEIEEQKLQNRVLKVAGSDCGKILIVEDEVELAEVLEFNLIRKGFDVLVAQDGLAACRIIGREKPDLVLLDLMLPLLDGWEICRMVRSHQDFEIAKTPIIMLSALGSSDDRIKGYDFGADLYLPKPYVIKEVIIKSRQLIEQRREFLQLTEKVNSLKSWNEMQDQWQQALFHEFRNQLTVISGMAEYLQQSTLELPPKRSLQFADQIVDSTYYLGALAENYLLVRQLENGSGQLQTEPVVLENLLAEVLQLFKPAAVQKACELELVCPSDIVLTLHPTGLKIILSSLLDNALKYTPLDGFVSLTVEADETRILIRIQDDGPGIPEAEQNKVFDQFYRGASARNTTSGNGLGLYMARSLAQSMGGSLRFAEKHLPGCCLELCLSKSEDYS